jgi:hypothetical protein
MARVVDQIVHVLAQQFTGVRLAQQSHAGSITEGTAAFEVDPIDGFRG